MAILEEISTYLQNGRAPKVKELGASLRHGRYWREIQK